MPAVATPVTMAALKKSGGVVKENRGASLIDLGDGVLGVEFHTKMNSVDDDLANMMRAAVEEARTNWRAIVIANDAPNFSVGANVAAGHHGREDAAVGAAGEGRHQFPAGESGDQI